MTDTTAAFTLLQMKERTVTINGLSSTVVVDRGQVLTRTDIADEVEAMGFRDGLKANGFSPRVICEGGVWMVLLNTTLSEVVALLA